MTAPAAPTLAAPALAVPAALTPAAPTLAAPAALIPAALILAAPAALTGSDSSSDGVDAANRTAASREHDPDKWEPVSDDIMLQQGS
ncbi:hypothetical protein FJ423_11030 [Mesorhizobium sp. B2-8-9]|nr:hypothetical protein FJ423_11030 [Mesorhizobium sp. B2-8-9]